MKLFINDVPIYFEQNIEGARPVYDNVIDYRKSRLNETNLIDNVFVKNASSDQMDNLLEIMSDNKVKGLNSVTFSVDDYEKAVKIVKKKFLIIKAAGGVVHKNDQILMIYRLGKWDLPKGKMDPGEQMKETAKREVEEECNIRVDVGGKICNTWHTYTRNGKRILKKTGWYFMTCADDRFMRPQMSENIDKVQWMSEPELRTALKKSYRSVRHVFQVMNERYQSIG